MFTWFEKRVDPFPPAVPAQPPSTLAAFCWHYTKDMWPWLLVISVLVAMISGLQIMLFGFMGNLVDWLGSASRETFVQDEFWSLFWMGLIILVILPIIGFVHTLFMHQTIAGNYPMQIRWKAHRYMLAQSYGFYQDEFAGRVATKVMQTALGVRETVMKVIDVFVYVAVYFLGALLLVATLDVWLMVPFVVWLVAYITLLRIILPKMRHISELQSNARSTMTGRIVDSYTNMMTVKLFAHANREEAYAKDSMEQFLDTVHPQMRLVTVLNTSLDLVNSLLLFSVAAIGIWSWQSGIASVGAVAVGVGLVLRLEGMSHWVMWELAGLFENIGMAQDGMGTIAQPQSVVDKRDAKQLVVSKGDILFDQITFNYGKDD
ncbi:MAG: ABC transporter transmembrane domain-containing protein, partial [Pseudomonadota bacterium]